MPLKSPNLIMIGKMEILKEGFFKMCIYWNGIHFSV